MLDYQSDSTDYSFPVTRQLQHAVRLQMPSKTCTLQQRSECQSLGGLISHPSIYWVDHHIIQPACRGCLSPHTHSVQSVRHAILDESLCDTLAVTVGSMQRLGIFPQVCAQEDLQQTDKLLSLCPSVQ